MARLFIVLAFIASASAAPAVEAVGCAKGTYYWGAWLGTQYCVKCPTGMESQGCTAEVEAFRDWGMRVQAVSKVAGGKRHVCHWRRRQDVCGQRHHCTRL